MPRGIPNKKPEEQAGEKPQYKLLEASYIDDQYLDPATMPVVNQKTGEREAIIITFLGIPGAHMEPVNAAAKAMVEKYPPVKGSPVDKLSLITEAGTQATKLVQSQAA